MTSTRRGICEIEVDPTHEVVGTCFEVTKRVSSFGLFQGLIPAAVTE